MRRLQGKTIALLAQFLSLGPLTYLALKFRNSDSLRVQVPNNHILTQNLYYKYYYPKPKYLTIGYMDPLGLEGFIVFSGWSLDMTGKSSEKLVKIAAPFLDSRLRVCRL